MSALSFASMFMPQSVLTALTAAYFMFTTWQALGQKEYNLEPTTINHTTMNIYLVPALKDNYMYLLVDKESG